MEHKSVNRLRMFSVSRKSINKNCKDPLLGENIINMKNRNKVQNNTSSFEDLDIVPYDCFYSSE